MPSLPPSLLLGLNVYDIRIPCEVPGLCYDFSHVETFLQDPEVGREGDEGGRTVEKWKLFLLPEEHEKVEERRFLSLTHIILIDNNRCCAPWGCRPRPAHGSRAIWR